MAACFAWWQTYTGGRHAPGVLPWREEHVKRIGCTRRCCTLTRLLWRHTGCAWLCAPLGVCG